jgi:ELWxxDGT repeat protein
MSLWESIVMGPRFYFAANGTAGQELYASDGTAAGTVLVKDINPSGGSNPRLLLSRENLGSVYDRRPFRGKVLFLANDGTNGLELWASDGTTAGTTMLKNINASGDAFNLSGDLRYFFTWSKLFIAADNGVNGIELWETDGTSAGTVMVQDMWPGASSSAIDIFGVAESTSKLVFRANNGDGPDIYSLNATVTPFPLNLTSFSAELNKHMVEIKWTTQQEVNVSHFNIQRSVNAIEFGTLGKLLARGGTTETFYTFTDNLPGKAGTYFYRLETVDKNGKISYSKIITLKVRAGLGLTVTTTANDAILHLTDVNGEVCIRITDITGRVISQYKQYLGAGIIAKLPLNGLSQGMYFITVEYDGTVATERIIR